MKTNDIFENGHFYVVTLSDQLAHLTCQIHWVK